MVVLILLLAAAIYLVGLIGKWIFKPLIDWKRNQKTCGLEDSIQWNSDNLDPSILLNQIHNPVSAPQSSLASPTSRNPTTSLYLSVVVPAYNESQRLAVGLSPAIEYLTARALQSQTFRFEIIIVDDGSTDQTTEAAIRLSTSVKITGGQIRIVQLTRNRGKGFATRIGVQCARGKFILMVDADGATQFSDLQKLETALTKDGETSTSPSYDLAIGSRRHLINSDAVCKRAFYRNILMHAFHAIVSAVVGDEIKDTQCGFKLFTRDSARSLFTSLHIHRWAFDVELVVLASILNYRIAEVPVTWTEIPGSKLQPVVAGFQMTRDVAAIKLLYFLGVWHPK